LLCLKEIPKPDDAADAIAIAICHLNTAKTLSYYEKKVVGSSPHTASAVNADKG
ncbi:MAG: crossover junction endodeoxyribonuclease RuvC, partial [Candidatus Margulisbacteria bacterium]|nr:crossover junction endodeoxyribonuclease RuvC [Candidatus Margulisiibacteriota bacterium]